MAAIAGKSGKVMVGAATVAFVNDWSANISDALLETTGLGAATGKTYIANGLPDNGFSINWKATDLGDAGTLTFLTNIQAGTGCTLLLYTSATKYFTSAASSAFIESFDIGASVDGLVAGSASGKASGGFTYT
jgi:hypothetical protein